MFTKVLILTRLWSRWKNLNKLWYPKASQWSIPDVWYCGVNTSEPKDKAEASNKFFIKAANKVADSISPSADPNEFLPRNNSPFFLHSPVGHKEVLDIIKDLNTADSGLDEITPEIIRWISDYISAPLAYIINLFFREGSFPDTLKWYFLDTLRSINLGTAQTWVPISQYLSWWFPRSLKKKL